MAAAKKGRSQSTTKQATDRKQWPNLPDQLLMSIAGSPKLGGKSISPGSIKSWATISQRCNKTLHLQWPPIHDLQDYLLKNSLTKKAQVDWIPWSDIAGIPFRSHAWKYSPGSSTTSVAVTGMSNPAIMQYNRSQRDRFIIKYEWIKTDCCTEIDPYDSKKKLMKFTSIASFHGKFYALSLHGALAVIEEKNSHLVITAIGANRAVPSVTSKHFKEHLFESDSEILLLLLIYRKTLCIVDEVEVFRLKIPELRWIKVENLQEKAVFLYNDRCIWVKGRQVGCRGNCVYLSENGGDEWSIYDMESSCMFPAKSLTF